MTPLRISATILEKFRLWYREDWMPEAELVDAIKGAFAGNRETKIGRAYHALLERPQLALSGLYEKDGLAFEATAVDQMLALVPPAGVFEVKSTKLTMIAQPFVCEIRLVSKADHLYGLALNEFKTTLDSSVDVEKYMHSFQWRVMAMIFEPRLITYHVARLEEAEDDVFELRGAITSFNVFPYADLAAEVRDLIREFVTYLRRRGLDSYLREKYPQAEAV